MAKCYVGTWAKYNEGIIEGKTASEWWLDLAKYETYKDFVAACKALHKNESEPEFLILDWDNRPDGFPAAQWISESAFNDIKEAMQEEEKSSLEIVDYSEKAIALVGDTKTIKEQLKKLGGKFNPKLSCGAGWVFPKSKLAEVQKFVDCGELSIYKQDKANKQQRDEALWEEYKQLLVRAHGEKDYNYFLKNTSELMRTESGIILAFPKEKITVDFCWADEGAPYEHYKQVHESKDTLQEYFLSENLRKYDDLISEMETRKNRWGSNLIPVYYEHIYHTLGKLGYANEIRMQRLCDVIDDEQDPRSRDSIHRMSENEIKQALTIIKNERVKFEKRLHTYLKKYGTSKLHTWTYWADR